MEILHVEAFTFDELSESAKEKARDWWRTNEPGHEWWDSVYEDALAAAEIIGVNIAHRDKRPALYFSGFYSQGDGACFEGSYHYAKGAAKRIREYAPKDTRLHEVADCLQRAQRPFFYRLYSEIETRGIHSHSGAMTVTTYTSPDAYNYVGDPTASEIQDALRMFADWIYRQLEKEYEYLASDCAVDAAILANNYRFTGQGEII